MTNNWVPLPPRLYAGRVFYSFAPSSKRSKLLYPRAYGEFLDLFWIFEGFLRDFWGIFPKKCKRFIYSNISLAFIHRKHAITDLFVAIFVILALAFVPASFLVYLVTDRVNKSKHIQLVSGLHPIVYWCGNYTWDVVRRIDLFISLIWMEKVAGPKSILLLSDESIIRADFFFIGSSILAKISAPCLSNRVAYKNTRTVGWFLGELPPSCYQRHHYIPCVQSRSICFCWKLSSHSHPAASIWV